MLKMRRTGILFAEGVVFGFSKTTTTVQKSKGRHSLKKIVIILVVGFISVFFSAGTALGWYFDANAEPIRMLMLGFGMIGLAYYGRRKSKKKQAS